MKFNSLFLSCNCLFKRISLILFMSLLLTAMPAESAKRISPINMIVVVDLSGSMALPVESPIYFPLIQGIVKGIKQNIQVNDQVLVIAGKNEPEILSSKRILGEKDIDNIINEIRKLRPAGASTDFGLWLEYTIREAPLMFDKSNTSGRAKVMLYLVTDGYNDPAENSMYKSSGKDLHPTIAGFGKSMKSKNWIVNIVGIGKNTQAEELAETVGGSFHIISRAQPEGTSASLSLIHSVTRSP